MQPTLTTKPPGIEITDAAGPLADDPSPKDREDFSQKRLF
jgi:hypothetical protein